MLDWTSIDTSHAAGMTPTALWLEARVRGEFAAGYAIFLKRRKAWIVAGCPAFFPEPVPPPILRGLRLSMPHVVRRFGRPERRKEVMLDWSRMILRHDLFSYNRPRDRDGLCRTERSFELSLTNP